MKINKIAFHRNGVTGEPFYVVDFVMDKERYLAVVFDSDETRTAVFNFDLLAKGEIRFGYNSYRPEHFSSELQGAISRYERTREIIPGARVARGLKK